MTSTVTRRSQITLDPEIRRQLGVQPGMIAHQRIVDGRLEVRFLPAPHRRSLFGVLAAYARGKPPLVAREEIEHAIVESVAAEQEGWAHEPVDPRG